MKKARIICTVATLVFAAATTTAVLAAKPGGGGGGGTPNICRFMLCAYPDCLPTEHTEIPAGQCCPVCVPN